MCDYDHDNALASLWAGAGKKICNLDLRPVLGAFCPGKSAANKIKMIVKIENVTKAYSNTPVIREMSLGIEKGERIVILGPSGCGKTTLLRMIAGFIHPDKGKLIIDG